MKKVYNWMKLLSRKINNIYKIKKMASNNKSNLKRINN